MIKYIFTYDHVEHDDITIKLGDLRVIVQDTEKLDNEDKVKLSAKITERRMIFSIDL